MLPSSFSPKSTPRPEAEKLHMRNLPLHLRERLFATLGHVVTKQVLKPLQKTRRELRPETRCMALDGLA